MRRGALRAAVSLPLSLMVSGYGRSTSHVGRRVDDKGHAARGPNLAPLFKRGTKTGLKSLKILERAGKIAARPDRARNEARPEPQPIAPRHTRLLNARSGGPCPDPRRGAAIHSIPERSQRQKPPAWVDGPRSPGQRPKLLSRIILSQISTADGMARTLLAVLNPHRPHSAIPLCVSQQSLWYNKKNARSVTNNLGECGVAKAIASGRSRPSAGGFGRPFRLFRHRCSGPNTSRSFSAVEILAHQLGAWGTWITSIQRR